MKVNRRPLPLKFNQLSLDVKLRASQRESRIGALLFSSTLIARKAIENIKVDV